MTSASIARLRPTSTSASRRDVGARARQATRANGARTGARTRATATRTIGDADGGTRDAGRADKRETTRRDDGDARGRGVELGLDERDRGGGNDRGSDVVVVGRR